MPFIRPFHPIIYVVPTDTTLFIVTAMKIQHKELVLSFKEVLYVKDYLHQKIITAVDAKYITAFQDCSTKSIKKTIAIILNYLFNTYGKITPHMITQL